MNRRQNGRMGRQTGRQDTARDGQVRDTKERSNRQGHQEWAKRHAEPTRGLLKTPDTIMHQEIT